MRFQILLLGLLALFSYGPAADASLWTASDTEAYRWDGSAWDSATTFVGGGFSNIFDIAGPDTDLYAVGNGGEIQNYDGTSWTDITSTVGFSGRIRGVDYVAQDEIWLVGATGQIYLYNGVTWALFKSYDPCPGDAGLQELTGVDRTSNYLWVTSSCGSSPFNGLSFCQLPDCSSFTALTPPGRAGSQVSCISDLECYVSGSNEELWRCGSSGGCTKVFDSGDTTSQGMYPHVYNSTINFGVMAGCGAFNLVCRVSFDGTNWTESSSFSGFIPSGAHTTSASHGAILMRDVSSPFQDPRIYHWNGASWSLNTPPGAVGNSLRVLGGLEQSGVDEVAIEEELREPSEFDAGLRGLLQRQGFASPQSQMFFVLLVVGSTTVGVGVMMRLAASGRNKNYIVMGSGSLMALFCIFLAFLESWMFVVALMVGIFGVQGTQEARGIFADIKQLVRASGFSSISDAIASLRGGASETMVVEDFDDLGDEGDAD